jgi:hypothetical protein
MIWAVALKQMTEELRWAEASANEAGGRQGVDCLCLVHDAPADAVIQAVELAAASWSRPPGTLAVITDLAEFDVLRALGQRFELLPSRHSWNKLGMDESYESFVVDRLSDTMRMYEPLVAIGVGEPSRAAVRDARDRLLVSS